MTLAAGRVLISEPFLLDPNFSRSVVILTEHSDVTTFGFVLNQKTDFAVNLVIDELPTVHSNIYQGGPVELETFHYLHNYPHIEDAIEIGPKIYWGGNFIQIHTGIRNGELDADQFKFFVGYSGWAPGQLEVELAEKAWIVGDLDAKYIFDKSIADDDLWKHAIRGTGGKNSLLANSPKDPKLN
ncbi:YqgE/AlgH family protein [Bacteroidia bacterium]|nr:YqgE/AlgH family protein [Bacteroidia bacterium]